MFTDNYFFYIFLWKNLEIRQFIRIFAIALGIRNYIKTKNNKDY